MTEPERVTSRRVRNFLHWAADNFAGRMRPRRRQTIGNVELTMLAIGLPYGFWKSTWKEKIGMLGWMIVFAIFVIVSVLRLLTGHPGDASARIASLLFAVLFLAGVLTRAARGRAW